MSYARKNGFSFKTFSLGDTGKTGKFNIDVNTNMGYVVRSMQEVALSFPVLQQSDLPVKTLWPLCNSFVLKLGMVHNQQDWKATRLQRIRSRCVFATEVNVLLLNCCNIMVANAKKKQFPLPGIVTFRMLFARRKLSRSELAL